MMFECYKYISVCQQVEYCQLNKIDFQMFDNPVYETII